MREEIRAVVFIVVLSIIVALWRRLQRRKKMTNELKEHLIRCDGIRGGIRGQTGRSPISVSWGFFFHSLTMFIRHSHFYGFRVKLEGTIVPKRDGCHAL